MSDDLTCTNCGEYVGSPICDRIEALEAEIARLRYALMPFAEAAEEADDWGHDDDNQAPVCCGQCREARAALQDDQP